MKADQSIQEIRKIRHEISAGCGHDLDKFFAFMKEEEKKYQSQIRRFHQLNKQYVLGAQPIGQEPRRRLNHRQRDAAPSKDLKAA